MNVFFDQFHFLRPTWLLLIPAAFLIWHLVNRRQDIRAQWQGVIAPHLIDALILGDRSGWRFRPINLVVLVLVLGGIGLAGPTWEKELPPFTEDQAPMAVVLDLSQSMDAIDIQPSRLERAKQKIRDLLSLRKGARTALFVYSGSAHMVLPLTDDPALLELFLASLTTNLMPSQGKKAGAALDMVEELLDREETPGTILFITDGVESKDISSFIRHQDQSRDQVMVLGIGTSEGGPIRVGQNEFLTDPSGRRVTTRMDLEGFKRLQDEAEIQVTTVAIENKDVEWIQNRAQAHLQIVQQETADERWVDSGYFLTFPLSLALALWFRKGWTIRWVR